MEGGVHPINAWTCIENDENLVEAIWASKVAYTKLLKVAWGTRN